MKNVLRFLTLNAVVAATALTAFAQQPAASPAADPAAAAKAACTDLYTKWRDNYKGDAAKQKIAYDAGKQFLTQCPSDEYVKWVANWVPKYEAAVRKTEVHEEYRNAIKNKNWAGVVNAGKQILANEPENLAVMLGIVTAGVQNASGPTASDALTPDVARIARQTLQYIESGKADALTPQQLKDLGQFNSKGEIVSLLNYSLGFLNFKNAPAEAATYFVKAIQGEGAFKKSPSAYQTLALAYQNAEYTPLAKDYSDNCAGKDMTPECKTKLDKLNLVVERIEDALARAVALADTDPNTRAKKAEWMTLLEGFYKFRHNNETTGLPELIANIQSKPLLLPSMQTMPAPTPSPTGTNTSGTTPATGTTSTTPPSNTNSTTKPADTTTTPKPATKPSNGGTKP